MSGVVSLARRPGCHVDCPSHRSYRSALAIADDLAAAWAAVSADPSVDVGDSADRHVAGVRVGRAMCVQLGQRFGHRMPATVVPCHMSATALRGGHEVRLDAADHLLLITDRAVLDLGLARCGTLPGIPPVACAERTVPWPHESASLELIVADVTLRYRLADHGAYRRSPLWRRTNREWDPVFERVHDHMDRLWSERGAYWSRPPLDVLVGLSDGGNVTAGAEAAAVCIEHEVASR